MLPLKSIHYRRIKSLLPALLLPCLGIYIFLDTVSQSLHLYLTPSEVHAQKESLSADKKLRVGGLVMPNTVIRDQESVVFFISDQSQNKIKVNYTGSLPSLFTEGQGTIVEGTLKDEEIYATRVLVKHDENYSPPKVTL